MIQEIPIDQLVHVGQKMTKSEIDRQWAKHFFTLKSKEEKNSTNDRNIKMLDKVYKKSDPRLIIKE